MTATPPFFVNCLRSNFAAAIDMLRNAVSMCTDDLWAEHDRFYSLAWHTTIFLDYYLTFPVSGFKPALPYVLADINTLPPGAVDDVLPEQPYTREELLDALTLIRQKCLGLFEAVPTEGLNARWIEPHEVAMHGLCPAVVEHYTVLEILFYNLRHVQHHVGQMNMILREKIDTVPDWVAMAGY